MHWWQAGGIQLISFCKGEEGDGIPIYSRWRYIRTRETHTHIYIYDLHIFATSLPIWREIRSPCPLSSCCLLPVCRKYIWPIRCNIARCCPVTNAIYHKRKLLYRFCLKMVHGINEYWVWRYIVPVSMETTTRASSILIKRFQITSLGCSPTTVKCL